MKAAAIDIGTNSIKLVVGERDAAGSVRVLREAVLITRLGQNLGSTGRIGEGAARRTLEGLRSLVADARDLGAERIRAVATSAMRDAANREEFIDAVEAAAGVRIEVISGHEEARLTRSAVVLDPVLGRYDGRLATVDVGGGSTELTFGSAVASVDVGAVRLHERFVRHDPPSGDEMIAAAESAQAALREAMPGPIEGRVVGLGGSAVNLARMIQEVPCGDYQRVHAAAMTAGDIDRMVNRLAGMTVDQRRGIVGLDPERADVILAGAIILEAVLTVLGRDEIVVSVQGLRHGLLYEMLEVAR